MLNKSSQIVSRINQWSDFDISFNVNPNTKNLLAKKDVESIKQSLKNLLLTKKGERPFSPFYGSNIYSYLNEPMDIITKELIKDEIFTSIKNYESRINPIDVLVEDDGRNAIKIIVEFNITGSDVRSFSLNLSLERVR
jgi:phage baseplate assembly protein W